MPNPTDQDAVEPFDLSGIEQIDPKAATIEEGQVEAPAEETPAESTETPAESTDAGTSTQEMEEEMETSLAEKNEEVEDTPTKVEDKAADKVEKPAETAKPDAAVDERDKDIPVRDNDPHMRPKLKKDWADLRLKAVEARNQAAAIAKEKSEWERKYKELEEKSKTVAIPKDVEEKLKTYEERLRELDITKDPEIQSKYDSRIANNENSIIETLKQFGLGQIEGKLDQAEIEKFKKNGITLKNVNPLLKQLEDAGEPDIAESIRETIRENMRLGRDKQAEIATWKSSYESKVAQRNQAQTQQQSQFTETIKANHSKFINTELDEIAKVFPGVKQPAEPLPTDTPAIRAAKEQALAEYKAAQDAVTESAKQFTAKGNTPEQQAEAHARLSSSAIMSIILKNHVLPKLNKDLQLYQNRTKELEAELSKFRKAGSVSKAHSVAIQQSKGNDKPLPSDNNDAMKEFAKQLGIDPNS